MQYFKIFLILLFLIFQTPSFAEEISWGETVQGIRCSLSIPRNVLNQGIPATVTVTLENISLEPQIFTVTAGFNLGKMEYWAPVKLGLVSEHLKANETFELSMKSKEQRNYQIDLAKLKWARSISSIWPYGELFSVVKQGKYKLIFDIHFFNNQTPNWAHSNGIDINIGNTSNK